jgi:1-pyrroline-5-carboxylate dehydrogenase
MATTPRMKITYATLSADNEELQAAFDAALERARADLGRTYPMLIDGEERLHDETFEDRSPIDRDLVVARFPVGTRQDVRDAIAAARAAYPAWRDTPWRDRLAILRRAAELISERQFDYAALMALEVGKNRMEALGDAAETADLIRYSCDQMAAHKGYIVPMGKDPLKGYRSQNTSVLRPYGVWVVISPFNFPAALTGGPVGAALVAGNTVVMKPASDTAWTVRLLAECLREAGLPDGVFNYVTGPGSTIGQELISNAAVDGITFTGSFDIGMQIYRSFAQGRYPRPTILEMGGKNPSIVSRSADLDRAAIGIVRSAFGLQGQKCSANSRVFIERPVYDKLVRRLVEQTEKLTLGDPTERGVYLGPVVNAASYKQFQQFNEELSEAGRFLTGGKVRNGGALAKGFFCEPTIAAEVPMDHRLWKYEMFLPITMVHAVDSLDEAMALANDVDYGLTAGFYGSEKQADWFFENIQAGVTYANRPQGATTGAWPGFQPFGGWKGSGSSGKNGGGHYYVPLYLHEQIHTLVR